jgi:hypothetical protein
MQKWQKVIAVLAFILIGTMYTGCALGDTMIGAGTALVKIFNEGIARVDSEISQIDKQNYDVQVKLGKLDQVLKPAQDWVEYEKTAPPQTGSWRIRVTPEELDKLKNDLYKVTTLEFMVVNAGGTGEQFSSTIKITDLNTGTIYDPEELRDELNTQKASFDQKRKEMLSARESSKSTIHNVLKFGERWKVQKINDTAYQISGIGLGWDTKLASGTWTYYVDKDQMIPADKPAESLKGILSIE